MNTAQHTTEKWAAIPHAMPGFHHCNRVICDEASATIIATVRGEGVSDLVRDSRLALIAAAPELLAACKAAIRVHGERGLGCDIADQLRAAIAKAEGKDGGQ